MGNIAKMIQAIIDKPDDLSSLPELVAKIEALESSETGLLDRVSALQEQNRKYLQMIPIPGKEPKPEEKEPEIPSMKDVANAIVEEMNKGVI